MCADSQKVLYGFRLYIYIYTKGERISKLILILLVSIIIFHDPGQKEI